MVGVAEEVFKIRGICRLNIISSIFGGLGGSGGGRIIDETPELKEIENPSNGTTSPTSVLRASVNLIFREGFSQDSLIMELR